MVIKQFLRLGLAAEYRSRQWVWSTVVQQSSEVYDTHRRTKFTALEMISRSRDMEHEFVHKTGSRQRIALLSTATINMVRKFHEACTCSFWDMRADIQTDRQTYIHVDRNTSHPYRRRSIVSMAIEEWANGAWPCVPYDDSNTRICYVLKRT